MSTTVPEGRTEEVHAVQEILEREPVLFCHDRHITVSQYAFHLLYWEVSFLDKTDEIPLFLTQCQVSSGKYLASLLFNWLKNKNANFSKLVSVSTDGATNMIGKYYGMAVNLNSLVATHCRQNNIGIPTIHSLWCFAHRINLVTKTFLIEKPVNAVLSFADWVSNKRRQVSYKTFLSINHQNTKVAAIPQPSDTRWLYYRDVVRASFLKNNLLTRF